MKEIIFNKKDYKSYKDFYHDLGLKLNKDKMIDWEWCEELESTLLDEFLWYCHSENIKYIFLNFNKEKIARQKVYDNYEYGIVIKVFERFVKEFPNNELEFRIEEDNRT